MPKGKVDVIERLPEPPINTALQIQEAESRKTSQRGFLGIRVQFRNQKNEEFATMLWLQDELSISTKLGSFCYAFHGQEFVENGEYDTDEWLGKWVKVLKWERGNNLVEKIEAPSGETELVTATGGLK